MSIQTFRQALEALSNSEVPDGFTVTDKGYVYNGEGCLFEQAFKSFDDDMNPLRQIKERIMEDVIDWMTTPVQSYTGGSLLDYSGQDLAGIMARTEGEEWLLEDEE